METALQAPPDEREAVSVSDAETDLDEPARQAAPRVAPEAAPEPEPEVRIDDRDREATQAEEATEPAVEAQPESAAERGHTALETVTEADETEATALTLSRPLRRPPRPVAVEETTQDQLPQAEPEPEPQPQPTLEPEPQPQPTLEPEPQPEPQAEPEPEPEPQPVSELGLDIDDLIREAESEPEPADAELSVADLIKQAEAELGKSSEATIPGLGGAAPLTASESDGLKRAIQNCWNLAALSDEARGVVVTLEVELDLTGTPIPGSIKLLDSSDGTGSARTAAFEAGRRAIRRCLNSGFDLPKEKFERWRIFEVVFDPEEMRAR